MKVDDQQAVRDRVAALMVEWSPSRTPSLAGEKEQGYMEAIATADLIAAEAKLNLHRWIDAARRGGVSWTDIGEALGISKQAAQQRFKMIDKSRPKGNATPIT